MLLLLSFRICFLVLMFNVSTHGFVDKLKNVETKSHAKLGDRPTIRVMTFNLWHSGTAVNNGLFKIAKHILFVNPDIVALQEVISEISLIALTRYLGHQWSAVGRNMLRPDTAVLTRHKIIPTERSFFELPTPAEESGSTRVRINVTLTNSVTMVVNVWSLHLDYHDYGPYAACNKLVTEAYQLDAGEAYLIGDVPGRLQNIHTIVNDTNFASDASATGTEAMLVLGDFNCPSHLDWIESTKQLHCDWVYQWPVTKILTWQGLRDAFRYVHPDPLKVPGHTWSTVNKYLDGYGGLIPEPQDRIDMIFYKSSHLMPIKATVYSGFELIEAKPNVFDNDWPSDHGSVFVDFLVTDL